jgi:hypothetical protein
LYVLATCPAGAASAASGNTPARMIAMSAEPIPRFRQVERHMMSLPWVGVVAEGLVSSIRASSVGDNAKKW